MKTEETEGRDSQPQRATFAEPADALPIAGVEGGIPHAGSSPYATGGGGVSFAHRVAAAYLASMLTGSRRPEAGELPVRRLSFQTAPEHHVDDLFVECSDGLNKVTLAIACRATPKFVQSHEKTVELVRSLLGEVAKFDSEFHQVAVAVAGRKDEWEQLQIVCEIARTHAEPKSFKASLDVDGRWSRPVRDRFSQFSKMVEKAVDGTLPAEKVLRLAWGLLSRLHVLEFAVQSPDQSDRTSAATLLDAVAAATGDGIAVRDRLEVEAARYDATGATVDRNMLRRDLHAVLDSRSTRSAHVCSVLAEHRKVAVAGVRTVIGDDTAGGQMEIAFSDRRGHLAQSVREVGTNASALLVSGESGTGKSALLLSTIAAMEAENPHDFQTLVANFRALPQTSIEFQASVGMPIAEVLAEMSAPCRLLIIDAADAALERSSSLLTDLVLAAAAAGVGVVAVTSDTAADFVREQMAIAHPKAASTFVMDPLGDDDIQAVSEHFPLLRSVLRDLPTSSLLRRLVVLDLLARTGLQVESSMGEWGCLDLVWSKIVRRDGRPGLSSPEAREQTLLAVAAATLQLPLDQRPAAGLDAAAVDALRHDHLLAPASPYRGQPEFAHDEVRRYATAILLVRARSIVEILESAGVPRWAVSSATLACKGLLLEPGVEAPRVFADAVGLFNGLAARHGARWADVPIEAVLETPATYECLKAMLEGPSPSLDLGEVVRVVQQRHQFGGLVDPVVAAPVVQVLLDDITPWAVSKESFELLADWLQSMVVAGVPAGNVLRRALRDRLLAFWRSYPVREAATEEVPNRLGRRRRRRALDYRLTDDEFVECLALLGPDIDKAIEDCLEAIAKDAPAFLAPAVDAPLSARAIALRDPELLAKLIEAYYIDEDQDSWHLEEGVRRHHGRWTSIGPPFFEYYFGGFWQLFHSAPPKTSVRVLNKILNHGAQSRVRTLSKYRSAGEADEGQTGATLNLDGTARLYVGDSHVWSWYRGTSVGPYSGMTALLAMERIAEGWLTGGVSPARMVEVLLEGCENLAVPGMLFGLMVRHLETVGTALDAFLAEPLVWELEFGRVVLEHSGVRATTRGLVNIERRQWSPREVCVWLMTNGGEGRGEALQRVANDLVEKGRQLGIGEERTKGWAANLDLNNYEIRKEGDQLYLHVVPPPEVLAAQEEFAAHQKQVEISMRLQSRYWASKHDPASEPLTATEIAQDLSAGRALLDSDTENMPTRVLDTVAQVVRVAVQRAVAGEMDALGDERAFAARFVLDLALSFENVEDQWDEGQYFDLGADRAIALTLPSFLAPTLATLLVPIGASLDDVTAAGLAMAGKGALETRLYLARGCDVVWETPCDGTPCIHSSALEWLIETARGAEIGPWTHTSQGPSRIQIEGDVIAHLQALDLGSIDIGMLDASIRGLGSAAAAEHCRTMDAANLLRAFLDVQRRAMVSHEENGYTADGRGSHTLIAARALLQVFATTGAKEPVLEHLDALRADSGLMSNFLHGLAAGGAENIRLADAARQIWPSLLKRALTYVEDDPNPYSDRRWGHWAAAALLPEPLAWAQGIHNEVSGTPVEWVNAEELVDLFEGWLPIGRGHVKCVDALIRMLRKLPESEQVTRGLRWVADLCIQVGRVTVRQSWGSNEWLKEIRSGAEQLGHLDEWQMLVDSMVVAGNEGLAPYSR